MSYEDPEAGTGRHRKPRPPAPPWIPPERSRVCGQHPNNDQDGPMIPPCLPPLPKPAPALLPPQGPPARHRRPRLEDPVAEGVLSLDEARNRKRYREYMRGRSGDG